MNNNTEISKIFADLKRDKLSKRQRTSLYLSEDLYKEFRLACGEIPPSKVIESLMRAVIEKSKAD